jgi:uncharacterized membrane protein YfhO
VNYLFKGIVVPKGEHAIAFSYQPTSFYLGGFFSLTGWLIAAYVGYRCFRRN